MGLDQQVVGPPLVSVQGVPSSMPPHAWPSETHVRHPATGKWRSAAVCVWEKRCEPGIRGTLEQAEGICVSSCATLRPHPPFPPSLPPPQAILRAYRGRVDTL